MSSAMSKLTWSWSCVGPEAGKIWLISSDTLTKIPELYDQVEPVRSKSPSKILVKHQFSEAGMAMLALLIAIPVAAAIGGLFLLSSTSRAMVGQRRASRNWPMAASLRSCWLFAATVAHKFSQLLGMPLLQRHYYAQVNSVALISAPIDSMAGFSGFCRVCAPRSAHGRGGTGSLLLLGERVAKAGVFVAAAFFVLGTWDST